MFRPSRARGVLLLVAFSVLTSAATAHAQSAWVLWEHSYEVWIDTNKDSHRRDVAPALASLIAVLRSSGG